MQVTAGQRRGGSRGERVRVVMGIIQHGQAAHITPVLFSQEESRGRMLIERVALVEHARRIDRHGGHPLRRVGVKAEGQT